MPNWNMLHDEIKAAGSQYDIIRRKYIKKLNEITGRNVIAYYSAWLQKSELAKVGPTLLSITDNDKNGFMSTIHKLDRTKGLDLILHTPGGEIAATESLVDYLRAMFGTNIRAIIPQIAMSAGTMIALACKEILMGKQSSLGPIDPQLNGLPAHGVIEEFQRAAREIQANPAMIPIWQPIIAKYSPAFIGECEKAMAWSMEIVREWLISGMFKGDGTPQEKADKVIAELGDHAMTKSHSRHISMAKAKELGLKVVELESNDDLQDAVLTVHHMFMHTFSSTGAVKIIENHEGSAYVQIIGQVVVGQVGGQA